jgi:hypothetical protein
MKRALLSMAITSLLWFSPFSANASYGADPIGLSVWLRNGASSPITLVGTHPRYIQELDITDAVTSSTDNGIQPLIDQSEFSNLDWSGVQLVEEDWRIGLDGSWTRQRFYRNAAWMERSSLFFLFPANDNGYIVGSPISVFAGNDNQLRTNSDSDFVRRFVARQTATGCQAQGDCSNAGVTYTAEGLVQLRGALHPFSEDQSIPSCASQLFLVWTEDFSGARSIPVEHANHNDFDVTYGFEIDFDTVGSPANGQFYVPGETVSLQLTYRDGDGNRLHPAGSLPTYGQFLRGEIESGLRYVDFSLNSTLYYGLKHREGNSLISIAGPLNKLKVSSTVVDPFAIFFGDATVATVAADGYSAAFNIVPSGPSILGGFQDPALFDLPQSDVVTLRVPLDAQPGTYILATKARREWGGEASNRAASLEIQVGTQNPTNYYSTVNKCGSCHKNNTSLGELLHGTNDRRTCYGCHASLAIEPDNALDIRAHAVHDRSDRFPGDIKKCSTCHSSSPTGAQRGVLP